MSKRRSVLLIYIVGLVVLGVFFFLTSSRTNSINQLVPRFYKQFFTNPYANPDITGRKEPYKDILSIPEENLIGMYCEEIRYDSEFQKFVKENVHLRYGSGYYGPHYLNDNDTKNFLMLLMLVYLVRVLRGKIQLALNLIKT